MRQVRGMHYENKSRLKEKLDDTTYNVYKNVFMAFIIKGPAIVISLLTVPMYMAYFDSVAVLGVWYAILNVVSWVLTFDLGIGNGLRNKLTEAIAQADEIKQREYISSAYIAVLILALIVGTVFSFAIDLINWNEFFNISNDVIPSHILVDSLRIVAVGLVLHIVLKMVTSVLYALQKSATVNLLLLISNTMMYIYMLTAVWRKNHTSIIDISIAFMVFSNLPYLLATVLVFSRSLRNCIPKIKDFRKGYAIDILRIGVIILWLQIAIMVVAGSQSVVIARLFTPTEVTEFNIYYKIYNGICSVFMIVLVPIWSGVTKAQADGNFAWIYRANKKLYLILLLTAITTIIMTVILQVVFNVWLGIGTQEVDYIRALIMSAYTTVFMWHNINTSVANGLSYFKVQSYGMLFAASMFIPFSILLKHLIGNWSAVVIASIMCMLPYEILQTIHTRRILKDSQRL